MAITTVYDLVLLELDMMLESTDEFIRDDEVTWDNDPEDRLVDALALARVRRLWVEVFGEPSREDYIAESVRS